MTVRAIGVLVAMHKSLRNKIHLLLIFLLVAFLSGCVQTGQAGQAPFTTAITWTPASPSQTATPKPSSPKVTTPTQTRFPYEGTFSPDFLTSKARTAATRTAAYATLASRNAICDDGYHDVYFAEDSLRDLDRFSASSGEHWTVIVCLPQKSKALKGYTHVINSDGSVIWRISYEEFALPGQYEFLSGYQIDDSGKFLYLAPGNVFGRDGWCLACFFGNGSPLFRLDLNSGELETVLPQLEQGYYIDIAISPDSRYLVYSDSEHGSTVNILNLTDESHRTVGLGDIYIINGGFTWTPDGKDLLLAAGVNGLQYGKAGVSLFRLNMGTMELQPLLMNDKRNLVPWANSVSWDSWLGDDILSLGSIQWNERHFVTDAWAINIRTGKLIPLATPTPTPPP